MGGAFNFVARCGKWKQIRPSPDIKYAGGLMIDSYRGLKTVSHTGSHGGFKTVILRFPEQRFSVIVLANVSDFVPMRLAKKVADVYLSQRLDKQELPAQIRVADAALDPLKGEYRFGYSLWRVGKESWSPERASFDDFLDGRPQTLIYSGVKFARHDI